VVEERRDTVAERGSGVSSPPHAGGRPGPSTGFVALRALWIVANLIIGAVLWVPVATLSTWAFHPDPKDPAPGPLSQTVAFGLVFTIVAVACALIPYVALNWLFRLFDKTLAPKTVWWSSAALCAGAAAITIGYSAWVD